MNRLCVTTIYILNIGFEDSLGGGDAAAGGAEHAGKSAVKNNTAMSVRTTIGFIETLFFCLLSHRTCMSPPPQ